MSYDEPHDQNLPDQDQLERAFQRNPQLRRLKEYVDANLGNSITLQDVADAVSLEAKYLSSLFKRKTGRRFSSWLHDLRISWAQELLLSTDLSITVISQRVGYRSHVTFLRAFKRRTNMTARDYRRSKGGS